LKNKIKLTKTTLVKVKVWGLFLQVNYIMTVSW
jgi:hypothetical protein